jgi:hypothetical protein
MTENDDHLLPASTPEELALDVAAVAAALVPWVGGPVCSVLGGMSLSRKIDRVREVLQRMSARIEDVREDSSKKYVNTDDFRELLEKTLKLAAEERNEAKRHAYASFLANDIRSPVGAYDEKIRILGTLEDMQGDHVLMLGAILRDPDPNVAGGISGSISQTLQRRLPGMTPDRVADLAQQMTDLRIAKLENLNMMLASGAEELRNRLTPYGLRLVQYIFDR